VSTSQARHGAGQGRGRASDEDGVLARRLRQLERLTPARRAEFIGNDCGNPRHGSAYRPQVLALALVEDALRLSDGILNHARIFHDLFNGRALGQQLDGDMAKLGLSRETPRKSSLLESRREAREQWVRVRVPKEVGVRKVERVFERQRACRRVYARATQCRRFESRRPLPRLASVMRSPDSGIHSSHTQNRTPGKGDVKWESASASS
jgi:hypothetical protein